MLKLEKKDDIIPVCPHCKSALSTILFQEIKGDMGKRSVYFCPSCRSALGVSHRKGLTFGL